LLYAYKIIEWIPNKILVIETEEGPFPMQTTYSWKSLNNLTTEMTLRNTGEPKGFSTIFSVLMVPMMKRANKKNLNFFIC